MAFASTISSRLVPHRGFEPERRPSGFLSTEVMAGWVRHAWGFCSEEQADDRVPGLFQGILCDAFSGAQWLDVRARFGGQIFFSTLGVPLIEQAFGRGMLSFEIKIWGEAPGCLRLEALAADGVWREFHRGEDFSPGARDASIATAPANSLQDKILRWLRRQHQHPEWDAAQCLRALTETEAVGVPLVVPETPWWGNLESSKSGTPVQVDHWQLSVWGWISHEKAHVVKVEAWVHPWLPSELEYQKPRPDVPQVFPDLSGDGLVGFEGQVVVPSSLPAPWNLTVTAKLDDGTCQVVFVRRIYGPACAEELHDELPVYSHRAFWRAIKILRPTLGGWSALWSERAALREARAIFEKNGATEIEPNRKNFWHAPVQPALQSRALSVAIVNDNFSLGGAALFAFEYARYLKQVLKWEVHMIAPCDGPLRTLCENVGLRVTIVNPLDATQLDAGFDWQSVNLIVVNTFVARWAVSLAERWGKPSLLYWHEGARMRMIFGRETTEEIRVQSAEAMRSATCVVFVTQWTRSHHAQLERNNNFRLLRSWVDLARVDQFLAQNDVVELRRRHAIPEKNFVFVCMGSICDRKGQRTLIRAVQWLRQGGGRVPDRHREITVMVVGARPTPDAARMAEEVELLDLGEVRLIAETPQVWEFLMLADAYVCPSFVEGFPRSLMEAAAMRKWIIATSIPGNREMLTEAEAWMVPAGDPPALAQAMQRVMKAADGHDYRRPDAARWKMERWFDDTQSLPVHAALAFEVAQRMSVSAAR